MSEPNTEVFACDGKICVLVKGMDRDSFAHANCLLDDFANFKASWHRVGGVHMYYNKESRSILIYFDSADIAKMFIKTLTGAHFDIKNVAGVRQQIEDVAASLHSSQRGL